MSDKLDCTKEASTALSTVTRPSTASAQVTVEALANWLKGQSGGESRKKRKYLAAGVAAFSMALSPQVAKGANTFPIEHAEICVGLTAVSCDDVPELDAATFEEEFPACNSERWRVQELVKDYWDDADN